MWVTTRLVEAPGGSTLAPIQCFYRKDEEIDMVIRIYEPDLDKMKTWKAPKAEKLSK
jgi:hypothetical protein